MGDVWAVTSFFNPARYGSRLRNFRVFRERLAVPLAAVELSFDGEFELSKGDADILIQIRGGDVMWQKERLLNVGIEAMPPACDKIAWLDCDVVFEDDCWAERASKRLDDGVALLHLFETRIDLQPGSSADRPNGRQRASLIAEWLRGERSPSLFARPQALKPVAATGGLAWAARRSVLVAHGLYDRAVLGSGDRALLNAAIGRPDWAAEMICMNPAQRNHFDAWALPFHQAVRNAVGFLDGRVLHLWHGEPARRRYLERYADFEPFDFDPNADIRLTSEGSWRWATDKPEMHAYVRKYFDGRREDDRCAWPDTQRTA